MLKDEIIKIAIKKISDGFNLNILTQKQFEKELSLIEAGLLDELKSLINQYLKLKNSIDVSENSQVVLISKEKYILQQFNLEYAISHRSPITFDFYSINHFEELKFNQPEKFITISSNYDKKLENEDKHIVIPFSVFIKDKNHKFNSKDYHGGNDEKAFNLDVIFWQYFQNIYLLYKGWNINKIELLSSPEIIIQQFKDYYLANPHVKLLDVLEKNLDTETLSGFEKYVINVGERSFKIEQAGWIKNIFEVLNNGNKYLSFKTSKDENRIKGYFINLFIFQKKHLIKLAITLEEVERIQYIIYRDCEKVTLKNESEILIAKHYGNETIVFDTKKEALEIQSKIIEIREGMGRR